MNQKNLSSCCISHEFCKSASKTPNKIAVIHASPRLRTKSATDIDNFIETSPSHHPPPVYEDDVCFTYSEILEAVDSLSRRLRFILDGGVDPYLIRPSPGPLPIDQSSNTPRIVGIYMVPSVEYIISVLSVIRCGEVFMPLDPSWPKERVLSVVSSSTSKLILCGSTSFDENNTHQINKHHWLVDSGSCSVLVISMKTNFKNDFSSSSLLWPCENKNLRPFCYLMYTSGSTGKPKGVCGTEQGLVNRFLWMQDMYPLCGEETLLFKTSIGFIDHLQEILGALLTTCTLVIPPFSVLKENIFSIPDYLQDYSINRLVAVPSLIRMLIPLLQSSYIQTIQSSLKLLILSGEILHLSLWNSLIKLLPNTTILNLYGSTEVSGDCTYFDCKNLPSTLESETLTTVPIGNPIPNCKVQLVGEEIYVSGVCTANGYFNHDIIPLNTANSLAGSAFCCSFDKKESVVVFKTGDFAKRLPSGELVFVGRSDRTVKVNGHRVALEEIENTMRLHEDVDDAVVILSSGEGEVANLEAYIVVKQGVACVKSLSCSVRVWMIEKLPLAMIPRKLFVVESIPISSSGKVDYTLLASLRCSMLDICGEMDEVPDGNLLQTIKKAFCDALVVEKVNNNDNFFSMGGDSVSAAHASHKLGISMTLLYTFPTPFNLFMALMDPKISRQKVIQPLLNTPKGTPIKTNKLHGRLSSEVSESSNEYQSYKVLKMDCDLWDSISNHMSCAITRCNKVMFGDKCNINNISFQSAFGDKKASLRQLWKVHMESCVDASPLVVVREKDIFLYIGSHSMKFICVKATSGFVQWEVQLEGRVECSAAILGDFSQVIIGCYKGIIYFFNSLNGNINWRFQTGGEVKSQPVIDKQRHLVWCGSYDHNLYALDYLNYRCVFKLDCGGSIYGSPAIHEIDERLYFASTNGCMTALSLKAVPFSVLWVQEFRAPIFGSLSIDHISGNVICCLVNGHIVAVNANGSIIWTGITQGPIFGGPCMSHVLYNQVLVCSRDGGVYSFALDKGNLLWKHDLGDPIVSSAYIDENLQLTSDHSRLICVCTSSGSVVALRISLEKNVVNDFSRLEMEGDIFSSPVMINGRIFFGCRDDYVYCLEIGG